MINDGLLLLFGVGVVGVEFLKAIIYLQFFLYRIGGLGVH
jgi:hypothetical protein